MSHKTCGLIINGPATVRWSTTEILAAVANTIGAYPGAEIPHFGKTQQLRLFRDIQIYVATQPGAKVPRR